MSDSTLCKHLRTKSMYIPALAQATDAKDNTVAGAEASHGHYWCNCTMTETGPDDKHVGPQACRFSRGCFEE